MMVRHILEGGEGIIDIHGPEECRGEVCAIHNMTDHHMRHFPQHYRADRGIVERICPHGVGHPDPDDYRILSGADRGTHGCDGCCAAEIRTTDTPANPDTDHDSGGYRSQSPTESTDSGL